MDFKGLHADINKWLSKHYTPGRRGRKIQYIGIHHNAGNLSVQGCWNVWQSRQASAHYQVQSDGIIGQLVHDCDTAWALGNFDANCRSINIEHADISSSPWRISDKCLESARTSWPRSASPTVSAVRHGARTSSRTRTSAPRPALPPSPARRRTRT